MLNPGRGTGPYIYNNMKKYIASIQNTKGECWDLVINANNYKDALKDARRQQKEYGKLWSCRLSKED